MTEYKVLEHMSLFQNATSNQVTYYSPHHGVLREDSVTTKLRVVFNCSFPSSSGHSYNSIQLTGPTIQEDLVSIRLRFRQHSYVISADHAIQATPTDSMALVSRRWTSNVFYQHSGLWHCKCSISCNQVSHAARNRPQEFSSFHLSGANSVAEVLKLQQQVSTILSSAGFELRKWKSNNSDILNQLDVSSRFMNKSLCVWKCISFPVFSVFTKSQRPCGSIQ